MNRGNRNRMVVAAAFAVGLSGIDAVNIEAANLNANLVANPGFESVNTGTVEESYGLVLINDWDGPGYAGGYLDPVQGSWPNGGIAPDGGNYYYAAGYYPISQEVDLSTGDVATQIALGSAEFDLSAYFTGYSNQADHSVVRVSFHDSEGTPIGTTYYLVGDPATWSQESTSGDVSIGASSARLSISQVGGGFVDGYVDNVSFEVVQGDLPLQLNVDTTTGAVTIENANPTGSIEFNYYEITSPRGSLLASWNSMEDQNYDSIGGGIGQSWLEGGGSNSDLLLEFFLWGTSTFTPAEALLMSGTYNTSVDAQDLVFRYGMDSDPMLTQGLVFYDDSPILFGDFTRDGILDIADLDALNAEVLADTNGAQFDLDGNGAVNNADLSQWLSQAATTNGFTAPYLLGDSNLDGSVNTIDLNNLALKWQHDDVPN